MKKHQEFDVNYYQDRMEFSPRGNVAAMKLRKSKYTGLNVYRKPVCA